MRDCLPCLYNSRGDVNKLRHTIEDVYKQHHKSYYFSGGKGRKFDGQRGTTEGFTWRKRVLHSLPAWWAAAQQAAALLEDPMTTPAMWLEDFLKTVPGIPMYGWNYWA